MTDGVNVDFGLLGKPPDYVGDYVNAFNAGQAIGKQTAAPPTISALAGAPVAAAPSLADQVAALSPAQRAVSARQADLLGGVGQALKSVPYPERPAVLAHLAPALVAHGVPAAAIRGFDPSDENLDAAVEQMRSVGAMVAPPGG